MFTLLGLMCLVTWAHLTQASCFPDTSDVRPRRHFYYNGSSLPIVLETSSRPSHRLLSHIVKILLQEVLGYEKVEIRAGYNSMNATEILNRLGACHHGWCGKQAEEAVPETMVNLEIWMQAGFNMEPWVNRGLIVDAGPLGPSGRFGWFMPTVEVENAWHLDHYILDHWRALQMTDVATRFSLHDSMFLRDFLTRDNPEEDNTLCTADYCEDGIRWGRKCTTKKRQCAVLLSSYPALDHGLLKQQVDSLGLDVNIAWIGSHLPSFVADRTSKQMPTLFFDWTPNMLTAMGNYTRVKFPLCRNDHHRPTNCDFEINQLSKAMWKRMKTHTPEAHHLISKLHLTQTQYEDILRLNHAVSPAQQTTASMAEAACQWVHNNKRIWQTWVPKNLSNKTRIYLGGMFPVTGPFVRQPGIVPGAQMAFEYVNNDPSILPDYELVMVFQDTQCKADIAMKQFMYLIVNDTHPVAGILGPGCSETAEPVAAVSKHFNTFIVSYSAESVALGDRGMYPLFFRTVPQKNQYGIVYMDIFRHFGWKQVALLAEDGQEFPEYHTFLEDYFLSHDMTVSYQRKMPRQATWEDAVKYIEGIKEREAHIIILTALESSARAVICEAYRQKMTALDGYQWFLPVWFTKRWWDTDYFNDEVNSLYSGFMVENVPCTTAQMARAIQGHIFLQSAYFGPDDLLIAGNITVQRWKEVYTERLKRLAAKLRPKFKYVDKEAYASYAYDAVWVFAYALDRLLKEDPSALESLHTPQTTERMLEHLSHTNFVGVSGPVQFEGADRSGIINIYQFRGNSSILVGQYLPDRNISQRTQLNESQILWMTGKKPTDGLQAPRTCSVEAFRYFLGVDCDTAIIIANIMGVGLFGLIMVIGLIVVKKRYDAKVKVTRERMQELGLLADTSWLSLDQWEVSREHVVLNRKLGEGAFGTVYGGEALIEDTWVAVAVKTLKIGSNPEENLDFLSEAEMMKRFDHENIVKLLGVCTRGEPSYTIMEFMLHGDLKTYLLARRQLVGQDSKEAEDVTPRSLTSMALDVAQGLKYLTDLKYVHRDLACRNCLVHVSKHVKIGDFGMTRPIYDSDYYRFNTRGMLPVRWMAPESLVDGIFSPNSDIWSFGVLLFEIMTFGSFPYQGLSNKQVLEHVRRGNAITLPPSSYPELKRVLHSCWNYEPTHRPEVDDLVLMFHTNPDLVVPCLDAPLSSVAIEGNEPVEMTIHNRQSITSQRLRNTFRTSGDHSHLHRSLSQEGKFHLNSPTSPFVPSEPFSIQSYPLPDAKPPLPRGRMDSDSTMPCDLHAEVMSNNSLAICPGETDIDGVCCHDNYIGKDGGAGLSSPESPIQMKFMGIAHEDKVDGCPREGHAKDFWTKLNGTSAL